MMWRGLVGAICAFLLLSAAHAEPPTPLSRFEVGGPALSIALLRMPGRADVLVGVARGADGLAIHTFEGRRIWQSRAPAHVIAAERQKFIAFNRQQDTAQFDILIGHGGRRIALGPKRIPALIAPTTLQRTNLSALGPLRIDGQRIVGQDGAIDLPDPVIAVAALTTSEAGSGLAATLSHEGVVTLYPLATFKARLQN